MSNPDSTGTTGRILGSITSPDDLKGLDIEQLKVLADECRREVIDLVSANGGHFASSLGVVELTVALHAVYSTPEDKIIWDVGHQAYIHKMLTGRLSSMATNRRYGGLAGFPKRSESPHDTFGTGHASTSISAAAGFAAARDIKGGSEKVVAVIGDGSMTGGMAFEAMNHLGDLKSDVLVVLNDNQMAISPSTGGLRNHLVNLSISKTYNKARQMLWDSVSMFDTDLGKTARQALRRFEDGMKAAFTPGAFFEALGMRYFGPIDGHDMEQLVRALREMHELHHPKLLHIVTTKGKGFGPAEADQSNWHAHSGGFDIVTGKSNGKPGGKALPKYQEVFGEALVEMALKDTTITGITAAMASGTSLDLFQRALPQRFFDVGIAEGHAVTFAAGMAIQGLKPVCAIYSTFLQRAYDQLIHDVALQNLHVVFAIDRAGLVGEDGPTHHGAFDLSYLNAIPGLTVMAPSNGQELRDMLHTALYHIEGPVAIRYPRGSVPSGAMNKHFTVLEAGKGRVVRNGKEGGAVLLAIGSMVERAVEAADLLAKNGIEVGVADMRFLKPLDTGLIDELAASASILFTLEENSIEGGFGSAVIDHLTAAGRTVPVIKIGLPDRFVTHGSMKELLGEIGLDASSIAETVTAIQERQP